jgi:hypothetical protein
MESMGIRLDKNKAAFSDSNTPAHRPPQLLKAGQQVRYQHHGLRAFATVTTDGRIKSQCGKLFATPSGWAKWHANRGDGDGPLQINGWESVKVR